MTRVLVIGGGPSGLATATVLARGGVEAIVLDREQHAGGVPRHTDHLGFGVRDLRRVMSGPAYARHLVADAERAGVEVRTESAALDVSGAGVVLADGTALSADAVVLATGVRERSRAARLVPGDRPRGVFTTGAVQQLTTLQHRRVGRRAVIVGAEHVSFSAVWALRHAGCAPVAMVTEHPRHQTYWPLVAAAATIHRVPVITGARVAEIRGRGRVEEVVLDDGTRLACDTVVFTGEWVPDHELARRAGTTMVPGARSPLVDAAFHTSVPGLFAVGNLVHPAETADRCALDGRAAAASIAAWCTTGRWQVPSPIEAVAPIVWAARTAGGLTLRVAGPLRAHVVVRSGGEVVTRSRRRQLVPNRAIHLSCAPPPGPLHVSVEP